MQPSSLSYSCIKAQKTLHAKLHTSLTLHLTLSIETIVVFRNCMWRRWSDTKCIYHLINFIKWFSGNIRSYLHLKSYTTWIKQFVRYLININNKYIAFYNPNNIHYLFVVFKHHHNKSCFLSWRIKHYNYCVWFQRS